MRKKHFIFQKGFTIIELLAVMFVFIIVSGIVMNILVVALRGNNKTNALNLIQTNGNYALSQVTKSIRNATTLLAPFPCGTVDDPTATSSIQLAFPDGTTSLYSCTDGNGNPAIASNTASLIDTTNISVSSCSFTCGQDTPSDYPIIGINFSLQSKNNNGIVDETASASGVQFSTSVVIRNLLR